MISKKGAASGTGILFFVFFAMMLIVAAGIVGGVLSFYGKGYDFRDAEAGTLLKKVKICLEDYGKIIPRDFDLYMECKIKREVIEKNYFVLVTESIQRNELISEGRKDFEKQSKLNARNAPKWAEREVEVSGVNYEIFVAVKQESRKVVG